MVCNERQGREGCACLSDTLMASRDCLSAVSCSLASWTDRLPDSKGEAGGREKQEKGRSRRKGEAGGREKQEEGRSRRKGEAGGREKHEEKEGIR